LPTNSWTEWEDWRAGLYTTGVTTRRDAVASSVTLLSDSDGFLETAREMVREWPNAATHNLCLLATGRRAWVGQAACCYSHAATSSETREAWGRLSNAQQQAANNVADQVIEWFRKEVRDDAQTLFGD
jgi:hypothetical protein